MGYYTQGGKLYDSTGAELVVRGISHFGFNSTILQPEYLWAMGWKQQIDQIKSLGFNAVRVPFVPDTLYNTTPVDKLSYVDPTLNPDLLGKTPLQVLDLWMAYADQQGLYVMLDFHSDSMQRQYPTWFVTTPADYGLMYNDKAYSEDNWIRDLTFVASRYSKYSHFFAIDLYNEPEGVVRWSSGDPSSTNPAYYWKAAAEKAAAAVLAANPKLLTFVQGINGNYDGIENSNLPMNWGEDFQPEAYQPLNIPADKLVLSPHTYGPDVYVKSSFSAANFPANLPANWDTLFGQFHTAHAVVIGEWGGQYGQGPSGQKDVTWQNALVSYLLSRGMRSTFYWCYTPNSGDSGGILDDNLNVRQDKMALLKSLWNASATLALSSSTYSVAQSAGSVKMTLTRTGSSSGAATVKYATADGTAKAGTDYSAASGSVSWAAGDSSAKTVSVAVSNKTPFSGSKSFSLALSSPTGASTSTPAKATVSIAGSSAASGGGGGTTTYAQPYIGSFTPGAGKAGTVVTLYGSGFTGLNQAWVGTGHDAAVKVVSSTQVQVTIPADATTGAIGLLNPAHAAFTPTSFQKQ